MTKITIAKNAGYCYGVRRAIDMAQAQAKQGVVYTVGPLIHNSIVVDNLERQGIFAKNGAGDVPCGEAAIIRAHGVSRGEYDLLMQNGCKILDATCPHVSRIHKIVETQSAKNEHILIVGAKNHPEIMGICDRCKNFTVVESEDELLEFLEKNAEKHVSMVAQTTFNKKVFKMYTNIAKNTCNYLTIFDTICIATDERQGEAEILASKSDAVIVIGDKNSSNSRKLFEICSEVCSDTVFVQSAKDVDFGHYHGKCEIAIAAGASTPDLIIKEVFDIMTTEFNTNEPEIEESFAELLEQSLKTLHTGEKVTGIVTKVDTTDIHVDLGVKQAGYIPTSELSDDPLYEISEHIHVGDEIDCYVMRVNDVEGTIQLSKKRLDAVKNWEVLEKAVDTGEIYDCVITDINKGGVIATVLGIRVFVPASQTGLPREADLNEMLKSRQKVRITEVARLRRRVVGTIKGPMMEVRREAAAKVWETIEVGQKFKGIVKSFTTYGSFVDIGGVDGMIHISELSWTRVKHPGDVLKIGQEIDVYVIALDAEKQKISLGYKVQGANPWTKFEAEHKVDDVVTVKIVKFMPFGAFAEVEPGVDGLIHISQIADMRIGKPEEVLKIGQTVEAKITEIDFEKKKISLSMRALLDASSVVADEIAETTETVDAPVAAPAEETPAPDAE